jgi:hypothetical protein
MGSKLICGRSDMAACGSGALPQRAPEIRGISGTQLLECAMLKPSILPLLPLIETAQRASMLWGNHHSPQRMLSCFALSIKPRLMNPTTPAVATINHTSAHASLRCSLENDPAQEGNSII